MLYTFWRHGFNLHTFMTNTYIYNWALIPKAKLFWTSVRFVAPLIPPVLDFGWLFLWVFKSGWISRLHTYLLACQDNLLIGTCLYEEGCRYCPAEVGLYWMASSANFNPAFCCIRVSLCYNTNHIQYLHYVTFVLSWPHNLNFIF